VRQGTASQVAEKIICGVILSEAKDLLFPQSATCRFFVVFASSE
jgi:hypothetical protein